MRTKLPISDLMALFIECVEKSGLKCYDGVPDNAESPFYICELIGIEPKDTKTMYVDAFTFYVHCIAKSELNKSSLGVFNMIDDLREQLTNELYLSNPFNILDMVDNGLIVMKTDETGEKHAIESITINVCYGFKCK